MTGEKFRKLLKAATQTESPSGRVLDALHCLETLEITTELLIETSAERKLKKAFKSANEEISVAIKKVITKWKSKKQGTSKPLNKSKGLNKSESGSRPGTSEEASTTEMRVESADSKVLESTGDKIRDTARNKFVELLTEEDKSLLQKCMDKYEAASKIEKAIFNHFGDASSSEYKVKFRTLMFNLKDQKNGALRRRILMGQISADDLVVLRTEDLANEDVKRENNTIREKSLRDCERGQIVGATTDAFTCGKCRQSKCTYYQMQTRSADEPMTVYITCTVCRNRWKQ
eukprot:g1574.t1